MPIPHIGAVEDPSANVTCVCTGLDHGSIWMKYSWEWNIMGYAPESITV